MADTDEERLAKMPGQPKAEDAQEFEVEEDKPSNIEETEDGGAIITLDDETEEEEDPEFYSNLAEQFDDESLKSIATELLGSIELDKEARTKRDEQYAEGIRRTGLGDDAPGGAQFTGATRVVHPMLTKACVDFSARAIKELFPTNGPDGGPVKDKLIGKATKDKVEKAKRKVAYMNWQLTEQMPEFRDELEQLLTQVPLAGAQYLKLVWDHRLNRPKPYFIPIDDIYLPFAASSFYSAERKTHVQYLTQLEYERRVKSGMYIDADLPSPMMPDQTNAAQANERVEGKTPDAYNEDGLRTVFEIYVFMEIEDDEETGGEIAPYIISIDESSRQVLSIYRNWDSEDPARQELDWIIEYPFVRWRGAYPIGLIHMIGGLSAASTGALRALLDAAHINNSQTLVKLKGGSRGGQSITINPTQVLEIEGTPSSDDIRKLIMALPFNPPSTVLLQLLGMLDQMGASMVQTTMENIADQPANMPVGTTLALIEQGMTVFNAIHARLHTALGRTLKVLHRLNKTYLKESKVQTDIGELLVRRDDFEGPLDVVPVSDPNVFSDVQRFAQLQIVEQRAMQLPQLYDQRKVEELILDRTKIPDAKELLIPKPEPQKLNPVNENVAASMGRPIVVFPDQDHLAHLKVHLDYMMNPTLGAMQIIAPVLMPVMLNHIKDHLAMWYVNEFFNVTSEAAGQDISELMDTQDEEVLNELDRLFAKASETVNQTAMANFQALPPIIQQAAQFLQSMQPNQQAMMQPQLIAAQAAQQEVQRKAAKDQQDGQMAAQKMQMEQAREAREAQTDQARLSLEAQDQQVEQLRTMETIRNQAEIAQADRDSKEAMNTADNMTALEIAGMRGAPGSLENGTGINPNPNP